LGSCAIGDGLLDRGQRLLSPPRANSDHRGQVQHAEPLTPIDVERRQRQLLNELTRAEVALIQARNLEVDAKHELGREPRRDHRRHTARPGHHRPGDHSERFFLERWHQAMPGAELLKDIGLLALEQAYGQHTRDLAFYRCCAPRRGPLLPRCPASASASPRRARLPQARSVPAAPRPGHWTAPSPRLGRDAGRVPPGDVIARGLPECASRDGGPTGVS
jgi:hypothetical protein